MARVIPFVQHGALLYTVEDQEHSVTIESAEWWAWLEQLENCSFRYQSPAGSFVARREYSCQDLNWFIYHKKNDKLYKHYIGQSHELTFERLQTVAADLPDARAKNRAVTIASDHLINRNEEKRSGEKERVLELTESLHGKLAVDDLDQIRELLFSHTDIVLKRLDVSTLRQWLDTLSMATIRCSPRLCALHAWIALLEGQHTALHYWFTLANQALQPGASMGEIAMLQAFLAYTQRDFPGAADASQLALQMLSTDSPWRVAALINQSEIFRQFGNSQSAVSQYQEAVHLGQQIELHPDVVNALCNAMLAKEFSVPGPSSLSTREHEVLLLISRDHTVREIANKMSIREECVHMSIKRIYSRLNVQNRAQVIIKARSLGLL